MSEPTTEAGRTLLDGLAPMPLADAQELHRRSAMGRRNKFITGIVAVEAEARADAIDRMSRGIVAALRLRLFAGAVDQSYAPTEVAEMVSEAVDQIATGIVEVTL